MDKNLVHLSKFLSLVLRHKPEEIGVSLDEQGWVGVDILLQKASEHGTPITPEQLQQIVDTNDKKRFAFSQDGMKIRAQQGHSVEVDLGYEEEEPPEVLFHGTAIKSLESILKQGLRPMSRQYVHLSPGPVVAGVHELRINMPKAADLKVGDELVCLEDLVDAAGSLDFAQGKIYPVVRVATNYVDILDERNQSRLCSDGSWLDKFQRVSPSIDPALLCLKAGDLIVAIQNIVAGDGRVLFRKGNTYKIDMRGAGRVPYASYAVIADNGRLYDISSLPSDGWLEKFAVATKKTAVACSRSVEMVLNEIWDAHKSKSVSQALLDEYKGLTGKPKPAFMD
jgi:putative RNA 2'-phosphotransferase